MNKDAKALLTLLVKTISSGRITPGNPHTYLGYKEIHDILNLPRKGHTWGRSLLNQGLRDLAHWTKDNQLPAISGLIVSTLNWQPGPGYFDYFPHVGPHNTWWTEEIRRAIAFDWSSYVTNSGHPTNEEILKYAEAYNEGQLSRIEIATRKRCEALKQRIKSYLRYSSGALSCTVCGWKKPSANISGDIVEIHHVKSVASLPASGSCISFEDALKILVPLCPTCHRMIHARSKGGSFTVQELKDIMKK